MSAYVRVYTAHISCAYTLFTHTNVVDDKLKITGRNGKISKETLAKWSSICCLKFAK